PPVPSQAGGVSFAPTATHTSSITFCAVAWMSPLGTIFNSPVTSVRSPVQRTAVPPSASRNSSRVSTVLLAPIPLVNTLNATHLPGSRPVASRVMSRLPVRNESVGLSFQAARSARSEEHTSELQAPYDV